MDLIYIAIAGIALLILLNAAFLWFFLKRPKAGEEGEKSGILLLQRELQNLSRTVDAKLGETSRQMHESVRGQLRESADIVRQVTEGLTKLDETNRQVITFADQLQNLQDVLKNPKQRGVLGEYFLDTLLKNVLPPNSYKMQYAFKNGEIVDAAIFVKDKIIPVDSKFSLENYNRLVETRDPAEKDRLEKLFVNDLKARIQETAKYIRPEESTMDFAFMFIPHESIYYDLLTNQTGGGEENLIQRAAGKYKVIIVSPTSFLAYLQTVLQGLKAMQIEETAKDIVRRVGELDKHLKAYEVYHIKLGNSISTVVNQYQGSGKEFKKIDKDILRITGESSNLATVVLDKPSAED